MPPFGMHVLFYAIHVYVLKNTHGSLQFGFVINMRTCTCACVSSERSSSFRAEELDAFVFSPCRTSMPFFYYVDAFRYSRCGATLSRTLEMPPSSRASSTSCPISRARSLRRSQGPRRFVRFPYVTTCLKGTLGSKHALFELFGPVTSPRWWNDSLE